MKKHILLLFLIFTGFLQAQTYPVNPTKFGKISLNTNGVSTSTTKINTQESDGQINYIDAMNLPVPTSVINAIKQKADLSTGLLKNGLISINADPTKFNISAGIGIISNFDDPENPVSTIISFPAFTGVTPTYLLTGNITYIAINSTPSVVMQATPFTDIQRRDLIILGAAIHSNLTNINVVNNISAPSNAIGNQLHDFMEAVGALNITGNKYSANGSNLSLNKSAGTIFKLGVNFATNWKDPHVLSQSSGTALTFRYRTQNGTEGSDVTVINPALYDVANVLTAVPNNKFSIQTVTMFQSGITRIQYGQNFYDDLASAQAAIFTRDYNVEANIKENGITRAYIIVKNNATSLQNTTDSRIVEAQKFGGVASGGIALTFANIVSALGYTPANDSDVLHKTLDESFTGVKSATNTGSTHINGFSGTNNGTTGSYVYYGRTTSSGRGYYGLNNGTADMYYSDVTASGNGFTSNVTLSGNGFAFVGRNDGVNTFTVNKLGELTGTKYIISGGSSTQYLKADGSVSTLTNPVLGTGTTNFIPKWTGTSAQGNSTISDNGTTVTLGNSESRLMGGDAVGRFIIGNNNSTAYFSLYGSTHATEPATLDIGFTKMRFFTGATQRMQFHNSGGVSIGNTTDPGAGNLSITGKASATVAASVANDLVRYAEFITSDNGNVKLAGAQTITGVKAINLANNGNPAFSVNNTGTGAADGASFVSTNSYGAVMLGVIGANIKNNGTGTTIATFRDVSNNEKARVNLDGTFLGTGFTTGGNANQFLTADGGSSIILSGSATLDFPNTLAGNSSELTISVTGASDGDVVSVGVPNASTAANTCYTARVSATNTVTVKYNNYSAAGSNPASGTFKVKVFK